MEYNNDTNILVSPPNPSVNWNAQRIDIASESVQIKPKSSQQEYDHSYQHSCKCHDVRFKTKPGSLLPCLFYT